MSVMIMIMEKSSKSVMSMKKYMISAIAVMAMVFTACTEEIANPSGGASGKVTLTFVGGTDTKTYIDAENNVYWNEEGEILKIFETIDGSTNKPVDSAEGVVDGKKCSFSAEFSVNADGSEYIYNAIYPATAYEADTDLTKIKVSTPAIQNPTLTSFDPAADLLVSKPVNRSSQPAADDNLSLNFGRIVSIGKIVIKNLGTKDPVTSVVFTAPNDVMLNGRTNVNLTDGIVNEYGYYDASNSITLNYSDAPDFTAADGAAAIFTCLPCEIPAGSQFTVAVITANNEKYVKKCTIPETGKPIVFNAGKSTRFTVNFAGIEKEAEAEKYELLTDASVLTVGDRIVIAAEPGNNYALGTQNNSGYRDRVAIVRTDKDIDIADGIQVITLETGVVEGTFAFNVGDGYLSAKDTGNNLVTVDNVDNLSSWSITINTINNDRVTTVQAQGGASTFMQYNSGSPRFSCYGTASQKDVVIYYKKDTRAQLDPVTELKATLAEGVNNTVVLTWTAAENADQYVVTYGDTSLTVEECTATIEGLDFNTEYTFNVVAKNTDEDTYRASAAVSVKQKTGIGEEGTEPQWRLLTDVSVLEAGYKVVIVASEFDFALSTTQSTNNRAQAAVTKSADKETLGELGTDVQVLTLEEGTASGTWAFYTGSGYLYAASSSSNHLKTENSKSGNSSWTVTVTSEGVATVKAQGDKTHNVMQYNSSNQLFACYSGASQKSISVYYKKDSRVALAPVTGLAATVPEAAKNSVVLIWNASENANQYVVTCGSESRTVTECTATFTGLEYDTEYTFSVVAKNTDEATYKPSTAATVSQTTGDAPQLAWAEGATFTAVVADENKQKEVTLTWTAVENAAGYEITYGSETITVEAPATTTTVECPKYGTEYTFSIVAKNPSYKDSEAKTSTVTTLAAPVIKATVAEFLAAEVNADVWYELTGTISNITNTVYGNFNLTDESGTVYVYGLTKTQVATNDKSFSSLGLEEGYTVTIVGVRDSYTNTTTNVTTDQVGGPAYYVSHVGIPVLKVDATSLSFAASGDSKTVTVTALNTSETPTVSVDNAHFTPVLSGNEITVTAPANETTDQITGTLTISVAGLIKEVTLTQVGKSAEGGTDPVQPKYVKVTSAPADWSGQYLIVYEVGSLAFDSSLSKIDDVKNTKAVTITNNSNQQLNCCNL